MSSSSIPAPPTSWRADLQAGFLVFLVALPLSLGIAMASGFPPVAGVLTAIVGGLVGRLVGGGRLTIKGPAAGLIVIALGAVHELGGGDLHLGYRRALAVAFVGALLQLIFAFAGASRFAQAMPTSVVHGMLAAIGVIIIAKQASVVLGVTDSGTTIEMLRHIPDDVLHANPEVALIGLLSLIVLATWPRLPERVRQVPAPLVVLAIAVPLGLVFHFGELHEYELLGTHEVGPAFLVTLPDHLLEAVTFPDFRGALSWAGLQYAVMFAVVGTIESLLSALAVDSMDPAKRATDLRRDLLAVAIGNLVATGIGGLPMITEIVRSKANVDAGATGSNANLFHGLLLLAFVALAPGLLHHIPLAALAAMLVYTGARLASPKEFVHTYALGRDQLVLFLATMAVTLATDLLVGVAAGLGLKVVMHLARGVRAKDLRAHVDVREEGDTLTLVVSGAAVFTTLVRVAALLEERVQPGTHLRHVVVDVSATVLVDHTFQERLLMIADEWPETDLGLVGAEHLKRVSEYPTATLRRAEPRST